MDTTLTVTKPERLDKALAGLLPAISRSAAQKLIDGGRVLVNGVAQPSRFLVAAGDLLAVSLPDAAPEAPQPEAISLAVLYEDDDIIAVDKPAGMVVHPGAGNQSGTLVNAVLNHMPEVADVGDETRPGIVHRLDKETSGVLLVAKTEQAYRALQDQFKRRVILKTYLALCVGDVQPARATIDKPLARDPANRQRMSVMANGREAQTEYVVTERYTLERRPYSLLRVSPRTGRTHQIRVHLASTGYPVAGDLLYGGRRDALTREIGPRHMLHASELVLELPSSGQPLRLHAPLPDDMRAVLARLQSA